MSEETLPVDWEVLDKLRGKKWAEEVMRQRRLLAERSARSEAALKQAKEVLDRDKGNLKQFDDMLRPRVKRRRQQLRRLFGSLVKTPDGEMRFFSVKNVLDIADKRIPELIEAIEQDREGRKAVEVKKTLSREAFKRLSPRYLKTLADRGVTVGRMFYVSIKSTGEDDATNLLRERRVTE